MASFCITRLLVATDDVLGVAPRGPDNDEPDLRARVGRFCAIPSAVVHDREASLDEPMSTLEEREQPQ
jgi:hypothetical protein